METVAWSSDAHLDHAGPRKTLRFLERVRASGASALLLGGDISTASDIQEILLEIAATVGLPVHFVLGNHDYYGGSIVTVRREMAVLSRGGVGWLTGAAPRELAPGVALVGCGGWGDARLGDFAGSDVVLTDYMLISELAAVFDKEEFTGVFGAGTALETELRRLGQESADILAPRLAAAAETTRQVVVLTHVPPFRDACWHEGEISQDNWLPGFTCGAVGEVLLAAASEHPDCQFTVLCGHTHGGGRARVADNLVVHTQAAQYGSPDFVLLSLDVQAVSLLP